MVRRTINHWTHYARATDEAQVKLTGTRHAIRVEHLEIDGHTPLQLHLEPAGD